MNILIVDSFPQNFLKKLSALPVTVSYIPDVQREEILEKIPDFEILIINSKTHLDRELIDRANKLKLAIRAGVGLDHFDLAYMEEKGIQAENTAGGNADAVAEHTVGMLLAMRHFIVRGNSEVKDFLWRRNPNRGHEIKDKTVGIIGYGNTGKAVAKRLESFGCRLLAYDKYLSGFGNEHVKEVALEQLFAECEILSLHVPLTAETHEWVDGEFLARFQQPIYLLNNARGPIVHLPSLLSALDSGQVLGAALDVLPNEDIPSLSSEEKELYEKLFQRDNVILTPHIAGRTFESLENINDLIVAHVRRLCE